MTKLSPRPETLSSIKVAEITTVRPKMPARMLEGERHENMIPLGQLPPNACSLAILMDDIDTIAREKAAAGLDHEQEIADYRAVAIAFGKAAGIKFPVLLESESIVEFNEDWCISYKKVRRRRIATIAIFGCTADEAAIVEAALRKQSG